MDRKPVPPRRRQLLESAIRVLDLFVYGLVFAGGVALTTLPFGQATNTLTDYKPLIALWAIFLLGGGLVGFAGRLTRYWMIENVGTVAAAFGVAIYSVVLFQYSGKSLAALFTLAFVLALGAAVTRRWVELQIFSSEPGDWRHKLSEAWSRRTSNIVSRTN